MKGYKKWRLKQKIKIIFAVILIAICYCNIMSFIKNSLSINSVPIVHQVIVLCATNQLVLNRTGKTDVILMDKLERLVLSIAKESPRIYININIITNEKEVVAFTEAIESAVKSSKTITYKFVSLNDVIRKFENNIILSRNYTTLDINHIYYDVTLHVRAHFPKIFDHKKVVVLDLDLEFKCPFEELYKHFEKMEASQIFAMAHEQSPTYIHAFKEYREENIETNNVGPHLDFPGFNAGVILFDLEKMRQSKEFNYRLTETGYKLLFEKYKVNSGVGDQDFFTLLGSEYPYLYNVIDCSFNRQVGALRFMDPMFAKYYKCDKEVKIYHFNGQMNYLY